VKHLGKNMRKKAKGIIDIQSTFPISFNYQPAIYQFCLRCEDAYRRRTARPAAAMKPGTAVCTVPAALELEELGLAVALEEIEAILPEAEL